MSSFASYWLIYLLPVGFLIGFLTERISLKNAAPYLMGPLAWNTTVKVICATVSWVYLIHSEADISCLMSSSMTAGNDSCVENQVLQSLLRLFVKSGIICLAARFGMALQPVGLTGGIATGKSTVSSLLRTKTHPNDIHNAFAVIDVDSIAHDILEPGKMKEDCGYDRVVDAFTGHEIFQQSDSSRPPIDRRKLGDIIFRDPIQRRMLNKITHPLISKIMMKQIVKESYKVSSSGTSIVAVDVPLLFEIGLKMKILFGIKFVVACSPEIQLQRLMERNKDLTKEQCEERIASQIPVSEKVKMADIVIYNNGTYEELQSEVERARDEIIARTHGFMGISLIKVLMALNLFVTLLYASFLAKLKSTN
jgi:dephospho-CoA kinase